MITYLTDGDNQSVQNKTLKIQIADKIYTALTGKDGKATLTVNNLKPNDYNVKIYFEGDEDYAASQTTTSIKVKKAPLAIKLSNYNTYVDSDLFLKLVYTIQLLKML